MIDDVSTTDDDRYFKASSQLPTPVAIDDCVRMWIPAARVTADHNTDEILRSLADGSQPETWKTHRASLRDFVRIPNQGISFLCTSDAALHSLGGIQLTICGKPATIRKHSKYDRLYFVDLTRLPSDVPDRTIYNWFLDRGARPVLITPTFVEGELKSRDRTVYFNSQRCPSGLFLEDDEPLREIYFDTEEKPCFVQHRIRKYNRVKPPSLRKPIVPQSPTTRSDDGDNSMRGDDTSSRPDDAAVPADDVSISGPIQPSLQEPTPSSAPGPASLPRASGVSTRAKIQKKTLILDTVSSTDPTWKLVQASRRGVTTNAGPSTDPTWKLVQASRRGVTTNAGPVTQPEGLTPCTLIDDASDPAALPYEMVALSVHNTYEVLTDYAYDEAQPPDVDIQVYTEDGSTITGFLEDSSLVVHRQAAQTLMQTRKLTPKASHVSAADLDALIAEFIAKDVQQYQSHEDLLAAIEVQPAYLRQMYKLPTDWQERTHRAHAVYRATRGLQLPGGQTDVWAYLQSKFTTPTPSPSDLFDYVFPTDETRGAALCWSRCDLFLMVFAPGVYFDPVKLKMLLPDKLQAKRLRNTPFLLWSDVNLQFLTHTDMVQVFQSDTRTPTSVQGSLKFLKDTQLPPVETVPSQVVHTQL
ncbi:Hypothetical protein PHPALM_9621 [Phytophthora palmivora]|uniref:Uncharacterized protein n=1 Tax=Phytophthora palmivora TaxID=4796 RepID=A0A2P4Y6T9_9STRA|nr:Hypothetical protein PHPALM_9621 [Phytophthora palmivora]